MELRSSPAVTHFPPCAHSSEARVGPVWLPCTHTWDFPWTEIPRP